MFETVEALDRDFSLLSVDDYVEAECLVRNVKLQATFMSRYFGR